MIGQYRRGHADSQPYLVEDEGTGQLVPVFLPGDAVTPAGQPGVKAGNPLLDEISERARRADFIEQAKERHRK